MADAVPHPLLRVARAFDTALTNAAREAPSSDFGVGALAAIVAIADAAGMSGDPRVAAIRQRISEATDGPRDGEHVA